MWLRRRLLILSLLVLQTIPAGAQYRERYPLANPELPGALGVNIHFNDPKPGEMEQLAAAGFRWIRQDFQWAGIERVRGQYDFAAYDRLMAHLRARNIRPIFILDYGNDLYEQGSPRTDASRAAFARFAAAAVLHFKNQGVVWEMWNEPNIQFWKPRPNVDEYIALALSAGKSIREAAPDEWYVGPGVSGMDFDFMEKCFRAGLLQYWDAVSFHPYRNTAPETAAPDFHRLRNLIARYAPRNKHIAILSSEWGYSEKYPGLDLQKQSRYIVRQALSNIYNSLAISIWYDWHDDGVDPKEPEHHFGVVYNDYKAKPTYQAIAALTHILQASRYNKRLSLGSASDYCLLFDTRAGTRLAVWTTDARPHAVRIPASAGRFQIADYLGVQSEADADSGGLPITLTDAPQYLIPLRENAVLNLASRWNALAEGAITHPAEAEFYLQRVTNGRWTEMDRSLVAGLRIGTLSDPAVTFSAPRPLLEKPVMSFTSLGNFIKKAMLPYRSGTQTSLRVTLQLAAGPPISQDLALVSRSPLYIAPQPAVGGRLPIHIENPTGAPFDGRIHISSDSGDRGVPLVFEKGQTEQAVSLPVTVRPDGSYRSGVSIEARFAEDKPTAGWTVVSASPEVEYRPVDNFAGFKLNSPPPGRDYKVVLDGDPKVKSAIRVSIVEAPNGLSDPQARAVRIDYDFEKGWKFLRLEPENEKRDPLPGTPYALGVWVYGDGSGDVLNARFTDASGQTFQPTAGLIDWRGWRFVSFSLKGDNSGHWSGADDGLVHYPIHLDTLLLVDSPGGRGGKGTIYAAGITLMNTLAP